MGGLGRGEGEGGVFSPSFVRLCTILDEAVVMDYLFHNTSHAGRAGAPVNEVLPLLCHFTPCCTPPLRCQFTPLLHPTPPFTPLLHPTPPLPIYTLLRFTFTHADADVP